MEELFHGVVPTIDLSCHKTKSLWPITAIALVCNKPTGFPPNVDLQAKEEIKRQPVYLRYILEVVWKWRVAEYVIPGHTMLT